MIFMIVVDSKYEFELAEFFQILFQLYALWIVRVYIKELQAKNIRAQRFRDEELLNGFPDVEGNVMTTLHV